MVNKHWWLYFLIVAGGVFFFGSVIYEDFAFGVGLVFVPAVIAGMIIWRAKTGSGAAVGYVILVVMNIYLGFNEFGAAREDSYQAFVSGCLSSTSQTQPQISDQHAATLCTCVADEINDAIVWQVTRDRLLFKETLPISENNELGRLTADAWNACLP